MRILLVEDESDISQFLKGGLEAEGFAVDIAASGERGEFLARSYEYDLVVLDILLPGRTGLEVCSALREAGRHMPILVLSSQAETEKKIELLKHGADDYMTKPFSFEELLTRIRALLRRPRQMEEAILTIADLTVDVSRHKVIRGNEDIYLTRKEFGVLEYLLRNKGRVVSRNALMEHVWDLNSDPFSNTVEAHILNLRKKVDSDKHRRLIHTIPGRGYKLDTSR